MLLRESIKNLPESKRAARQPVSSYTTPDIYRLNYNESPYGPSPLALQALKEASERPNIYPDWFSVDLKTDFAKFHGLPDMMHVCTATGSSAIINMLGEIFINYGDEVVLGDPSYEAFRDTVNVNGGIPVMVPLDDSLTYNLDAMLSAITPKTKMLVVCNPNNPTGTFVDSAKLEKFIKKVPEKNFSRALFMYYIKVTNSSVSFLGGASGAYFGIPIGISATTLFPSSSPIALATFASSNMPIIQLPIPFSKAARQNVWAAIPASNISHLSSLEVEYEPSLSYPQTPFF